MSSSRKRTRAVHVAALVAALSVMLASSPAPADIQEQRARLPPPAFDCTDPIDGVWMSHVYSPPHGEWYIVTLTMQHRAPGSTELTGNMRVEFWDGPPTDPNPPPCQPGGFHVRVFQPSVGRVNGLDIQFDATSWQHEQTLCGDRGYNYALDHHSGHIDLTTMEFQSVNNDGALAVNEPHVFRRIRCIDPARPPRPVVRPPAFHPPGRAGGCGCDTPGR